MNAKEAYLTKDGVRFLAELRAHNEKAWFEKNKARYEAGVRAPALRLVADLAPVLAKVSKRFVVDPRPNGGSLSRIHRDTRFSKDKSPYKTHLFVHFRHESGDDDASPGFFLRLGPGASSVGGGVWHPAPAKLAEIRRAIATRSRDWKKAKQKSDVGAGCMITGESLKNVPKGFDPAHEHAEDLRRKDFGASVPLPDASLTSAGLVADVAARFRSVAPVVAFVCDAIALPF